MKKFKKYINRIEFRPINLNQKVVGWDAYIYDKKDILSAGGTHKFQEKALRIGYAEFIERSLVKEIANDEVLSNRFELQRFPTTCGFAAGFSKVATQNRAILEAIERWAWSKWIDEKILIEKFTVDSFFADDLTKSLLLPFSKVDFFLKKIDCSHLTSLKPCNEIIFGALLCYTARGVFLGSRVSDNLQDIFNHSAIEANRAHKIYSDLSLEEIIKKDNFFYSRLSFYAENKNLVPKLENFNSKIFPAPSLYLLESLNEQDGIFLTRALMEDFIPWNVGDEKRFIY